MHAVGAYPSVWVHVSSRKDLVISWANYHACSTKDLVLNKYRGSSSSTKDLEISRANYHACSRAEGCTMKSTYPEQLGEKRVNYLVHLGWAHLLSTSESGWWYWRTLVLKDISTKGH